MKRFIAKTRISVLVCVIVWSVLAPLNVFSVGVGLAGYPPYLNAMGVEITPGAAAPSVKTYAFNAANNLRYLDFSIHYGYHAPPLTAPESSITVQASDPTPVDLIYDQNPLAFADDVAWFHTPGGKAIIVGDLNQGADPTFANYLSGQVIVVRPVTPWPDAQFNIPAGFWDVIPGAFQPPTRPLVAPYAAADVTFAAQGTKIPKGSVLFVSTIWPVQFNNPNLALLLVHLAPPPVAGITTDIIVK